ncbi:MAG: GspH/FimT family pseudopilin [Acidiferrobacteraceae bacterium]
MAALRSRRDARGFTLIEIAVVLLVIGIIIGTIGIELHATARVTARDQAQRLALLVHAMRQQAMLEGRAFGLRFGPNGYRFLELDAEGHWRPLVRDHLFRPRTLPPGAGLSVSVGGSGASSLVQISPGGILTPFTATLHDGDSTWQIVARSNGHVAARPAH